ncbi:MAG TPA: hypothetical protein VFU68_06555 [Terracidiphilus sp.]|nr:hypothetical protein [Terracidiphilus sp.]
MPPLPDPNAVFLNVPYDNEFQNLFLAYIVGLYQLGLVPHIALELPGGGRRLDRIFEQIQSCRYSIHDLSRIEIGGSPSAVPRFNMPLELGMAITWASLRPSRHTWFVFESEPYRLQRSASDLNGTDPNIHHGTPDGILVELRNAFSRKNAPSIQAMRTAYSFVEDNLRPILLRNGTRSLFARSVFDEVCWLCSTITIPPHKQTGDH